MNSHDEMMEALMRHRRMGLNSESFPLHLAQSPEPHEASGQPAQPVDQRQDHDPMKETGEGYETEAAYKDDDEEMKGQETAKENSPENYEAGQKAVAYHLGSENPKGLRKRAYGRIQNDEH